MSDDQTRVVEERLSAARPPYRMVDWTPTELAELLLRDREILRAVDAPPPASAPGDGPDGRM